MKRFGSPAVTANKPLQGILTAISISDKNVYLARVTIKQTNGYSVEYTEPEFNGKKDGYSMLPV